MRIIKIADVVPGRNTGIGRQMWESADATVRLNHEVDVFVGTQVMPTGPLNTPRHLYFGQHAVRFVREKCQEGNNYDVAELHEAAAAHYAQTRITNRDLPPLVVKSHGLEAVMWELRLEMDKRSGRKTPLKSRILTPLMRLRPIRFALKHCDQIIVSNSGDADFLQSCYEISEERITIGTNGVNPFFLQPSERKCGDAKVILFVGTWLDRKGSSLFGSVFETLHAWNPGLTFRLIGTGVSSEEVLQTFSANVRDSITVKEKVNDAELLQEYQNADIFFFPSFLEPWGLVLAEAAATGLPVLTTNVGGPKDFFIPNESAILVTPGDTDAMTQALKMLIKDADLRKRLGAAAHRQMHHYTWEKAAQTHIAAYEKAIRRNGFIPS